MKVVFVLFVFSAQLAPDTGGIVVTSGVATGRSIAAKHVDVAPAGVSVGVAGCVRYILDDAGGLQSISFSHKFAYCRNAAMNLRRSTVLWIFPNVLLLPLPLPVHLLLVVVIPVAHCAMKMTATV